MCCKSKTKPTTVNNPQIGQTTSVPVVPATGTTSAYYANTAPQQQVISSKLPKSTISFSAHDYEAKNYTNQAAFIPTKRATHFAEDRGDRLEDYAYETNVASQSRLLQPKELLTYDLDREDGVSRTPVVNTFHYQSQLSHCFLHHYNPEHYHNRASVYPPVQTNGGYSAYRSQYNANNSNLTGSQTRPIVTDSAYINQGAANSGVYNSGVNRGTYDQPSGLSGSGRY